MKTNLVVRKLVLSLGLVLDFPIYSLLTTDYLSTRVNPSSIKFYKNAIVCDSASIRTCAPSGSAIFRRP